MKNRRLLLYAVLTVVIALIITAGIIFRTLLPQIFFHNEPLHSVVESLGVLAAILMAILLLLRQSDAGGRWLFSVATGLLGMGILDGFHAVSHPGQGFVLLHTAAVLVGGFGFALVWLPQTERYVPLRKGILRAVITGSVLFGIWTFLFRETLSVMVQNGEFTDTARVLNLFAGIFFIIAAGRFLGDFHCSPRLEPYLFSGMSLLFGLSSLAFVYSALWDYTWWFWHLVRLSAYFLVIGFVIYSYRQGVLSLRNEITERREAENKLRQAVAFWDTVFNSVNEAVSIINVADFTIAEVNDAFLERYGLTREQTIGSPCYQATHHSSIPCNYPEHACPLMATVASGRHSAFEHIHYDKDGNEVVLRVSATPLRNEDGGSTQIVHIAQDITERKRAETLLRASEEKYREMIETSNDWIWMLDKHGNFTYFNKKAEQASGYNLNDWIGKSFAPLINPSDLEKVQNVFGKIVNGETTTYEVDVLISDGSSVTLSVNSTPMYSGSEIVGTLSFGQDITERMRAEESYRRIIETSIDGFWLTDRQGHFLDVNDAYCRLIGYTREELLRMAIPDIEAAETPEEAVRHIRKVIRDGGGRFETRHRRKNGEIIDVEISATYMPTSGGRLFVFTRDITARKRAEQALRESEENFRNSLESSPMGIRIVTADGETLHANPALLNLYGYSSVDELKQTPVKQRYAAESYAEHRTRIERRRQGLPVADTYEIGIVRKDGKARYLRVYRREVKWAGKAQYQSIYEDITDYKRVRESLTSLSRRLIEIQEEERRTIARELHDQIGQTLNVAKLLLQRAINSAKTDDTTLLTEAKTQLAELITRVNNMSLDLRPQMLDDLGLLDTLVWYLGRYTTTTGVKVDFRHFGLGREITSGVTTTAYRLIQEALTNVARHADIDQATVNIWCDEGRLYLRVEDKGRGFDTSALDSTSSGVNGMRERISLVGGNFTIESAPGAGTRVLAEIPLGKTREGKQDTA